MIYQLFPTCVYLDKDESLIPYALSLFQDWQKQPQEYTQPNFATTLSDYDPLGTSVSKDLLSTNSGKIIIDYIKESVIKFLKENKQSINYDIEVTNLWLNEMTSGSVHLKHNHAGYTLSGCFYVETPAPSNKIEFYSLVDDIGLQKVLNVKEWTHANSSSWWIPVDPGVICIFPSYLKHSVPQEEFSGVRRSIAFDIILKVKNGNT